MVDVLSIYYYKKAVLGLFLVICVVLLIIYNTEDKFNLNYQILMFTTADGGLEINTKIRSNATTNHIIFNRSLPVDDPNYLVSSSKCKIPNFDAFSIEAKPFYHPAKYSACSKQELLTYVTKNNNIATLYINNETIPSYTKNNISCCYATVTRSGNEKNPDDGVKVSKCNDFNDNATLSSEDDVVMVKCKDNKTNKNIYENVHAIITIKSKLENKLNYTKQWMQSNASPIYSVIFVGIDSISRLNLIRTLPKTYQFLESNKWISLKGYNKIADNTFPNLMAILTGYNSSRAYSKCTPTVLEKLDNCSFLWYDYQKSGYITAYAEDEATINTFNFRKKGFSKPPTDYYFRPYMIASEKLKIVIKDDMNYCTGPETSGERILNVAKDFITTFKDAPKFGFFWMNSFSHNKLMSPTRMDSKVRLFLDDISSESSGILNDTIFIFLSDHGLRFGDIRYTTTGWLEERLPFIYISIPESFKADYPEKYANLLKAQNRLTNPYDIYMTLQDILIISSASGSRYKYSIKNSDACPSCSSLFNEIPQERSCEDANIQQHWCTCAGYKKISPKNDTVKAAALFTLAQIHELISRKKESRKCAKYSVKSILQSSISETFEYKNSTYLLLVIEMKPKAVFEATVSVGANATFSLEGTVSRLDYYSTHSKCVDDANLKMYCYCR